MPMRSWVSRDYPQEFVICGAEETTLARIGKQERTAMGKKSDTGGTTWKVIHKDKHGNVIQIKGLQVPKDHQVYKILETIKR